MNVQQSLFYVFTSFAILAGSMVVISKNPVRAILFLVLTFFSTAGLWILLEAEFLAVTLVLVYVGAVMVLFLFVVMMLDIELASVREGFAHYLPLGLCVSALVVISLVYAIGPKQFGLNVVELPLPHSIDYSNVKELGTLLYSRFLYPFELAGILLLVAIVAAISLTFRGKKESKVPQPNQQVLVRKEDRVRLVKMAVWKKNL
jgi:NADH-quinone oxidoreductase subunit J